MVVMGNGMYRCYEWMDLKLKGREDGQRHCGGLFSGAQFIKPLLKLQDTTTILITDREDAR